MAFEPRRGPCHIFLGDPTTALGADMKYLGYTRGDVSFAPNINISRGFADQTGLTPLASSIRDVGATPVLTAPLIDEDLAKMIQYIMGGTTVSDAGNSAMGFSSGPAAIPTANVYTLACIPLDEIAEGTNGIDAPNAIWLPRVFIPNIGELMHDNKQSDDDYNPHTVEFHSAYNETDHDGQTVNAALRIGFIGTPNADTGLTWSLPEVSV